MAQADLQGIAKTFGDLTAVDDVNLTVEDDKFTVFVGPSGCGKTTTIYVTHDQVEAMTLAGRVAVMKDELV